MERLVLAVDLMKRWHADAQRKSGDPFLAHPLSVAAHVLDYCVGEDVVIAALLHDVVEDTQVLPEEIGVSFGKKVQDIVTAVSQLRFSDKKYAFRSVSEQARRLAYCDNTAAQLVKLCDRLHNMETIQVMPRAKQIKKAKETLQYFVPVAQKMGYPTLAEKLLWLGKKWINKENIVIEK